jgi:hypothetical protein
MAVDKPMERRLMFENLKSIWPNYRSHGATHLVLAGTQKNRVEFDRYRTAIPEADITAGRLVAPKRCGSKGRTDECRQALLHAQWEADRDRSPL